MTFRHPPLPPDVQSPEDKERARSARGRVLALLQRQKATTSEINAVGGTEGTRRLRELRAMGHQIESCRTTGGNRLYWLVPQ